MALSTSGPNLVLLEESEPNSPFIADYFAQFELYYIYFNIVASILKICLGITKVNDCVKAFSYRNMD